MKLLHIIYIHKTLKQPQIVYKKGINEIHHYSLKRYQATYFQTRIVLHFFSEERINDLF